MGAAAIPLIVASTVISAKAAHEEGKAAEAAAEFKAKTQRAAGTRKAYEAKRSGDIVASQARAAMAAGGGSASDPGAIETLGKIKSEAEYGSLAAMYEGETGAKISQYEGQIAKRQARMKTLSTVLSGGAKGAYAYNRLYGD